VKTELAPTVLPRVTQKAEQGLELGSLRCRFASCQLGSTKYVPSQPSALMLYVLCHMPLCKELSSSVDGDGTAFFSEGI